MKATNKMNPEIKALWVNALRSGEYQQGKLLLKPTKNTFCCLGVLCDLAVKAKAEGVAWGDPHYPTQDGEAIYYDDPDSYGDSMYEDSELPYPVMRWAGLMSENPHVEIVYAEKENDDNITESQVLTLAALNDEHNYTFQQLADLIERQL